MFVDPTPPGDLPTIIFVDLKPHGSVNTTSFLDPAQTKSRLDTGFGAWTVPGSRQANSFVPPSPSRGLPDTIVAVGRIASYSEL